MQEALIPVGDRGLPGVEVEAESWAGAGARGRSSTAGRGQTTMDPFLRTCRLGTPTPRAGRDFSGTERLAAKLG